MAGLQLTKQSFPQMIAVGDELAFSFTVKNTNLETPNTIGYFDLYIMAEDGTDWAEDGVLYCTLATEIGRVLKAGKTASFAYTLTLPAPTGDALTFFQTHRCARVALHTGMNTIYYWEVGRLLKYWAEPKITNLSFARCDENGNAADEGTHIKSSITVALADSIPTDFMTLILQYDTGRITEESPSINLTTHIAEAISGIDGSTTLITAPFDTAYGYNFRLTFGDAYESDVASASIANAFANLHLSGCKTGGFRFGGFSTSMEGNPKGEFDYTLYPYAGIDGNTNYEAGEHTTYGKWIDDKPIYRYVYRTTTTQSGGTAHTLFTLPNVDTVLGIRGMWTSSGGTAQPVNYYVSTSDYAWTAFNSSNQLRFRSQIAASSVFIIMEYTKTQSASAPLRMIAPQTTYNPVLDDGDQIPDEQALNIITGGET